MGIYICRTRTRVVFLVPFICSLKSTPSPHHHSVSPRSLCHAIHHQRRSMSLRSLSCSPRVRHSAATLLCISQMHCYHCYHSLCLLYPLLPYFVLSLSTATPIVSSLLTPALRYSGHHHSNSYPDSSSNQDSSFHQDSRLYVTLSF